MASQDAQPFSWRYPEVDDNNFRVHSHGLSILIFSVVLFFTLLCFYVRWACRGPPPASRPGAFGLGADTIKRVPVVLMRSGQALDCSICLGIIAEGEKVKVLPACGHMYHPECIDEWLRTHTSCPLCRAPLGEAAA